MEMMKFSLRELDVWVQSGREMSEESVLTTFFWLNFGRSLVVRCVSFSVSYFRSPPAVNRLEEVFP